MAIKPADNEAFYREVDEELRRDHLMTTWQRHGRWIVVGVLLLLGAIGGYIYWQHRQTQAAERHGETLAALFSDIEAGKAKGNDPRIGSLAKEGTPGYRAAALLTKADLAVQEGNDAAAIADFKAVAADETVAEPYRELALVRQTALEYDKLAPAAVIDRLKSLAVAGNPWFGGAGEMVAIAYLKQRKPDAAARIFAAMAKDQSVPSSIRSRAVQMAGALGVDAIEQADGAAGGAAATKETT